MSTRIARLTARRRLLQAECAVQRGEIGGHYAGIEAGTARADRVVGIARQFTPLLLVAGVTAVVVIGPGRLLRLASRGLTALLYANHALRLLR